MRIRRAFSSFVLLVCLALAGCSWVRDAAIDQAAGFPASNVINDVKKTSDEYSEGKREERVEELSKEYEEFLRSRDSTGEEGESKEHSIMIKQDPTKLD